MNDKERTKELVIEVLREQGLYNFIEGYKKEHNVFRNSHKKTPEGIKYFENPKDIRMYNSPSNAVELIGSSKITLLVANQQDVLLNVTFPSNIALTVIQGGGFYSSTGKKVTFNGYLEAGLYPIFFGNVVAEFGPGAVKEVCPEWWE